MKNDWIRYIMCILLATAGCKEKFDPPVVKANHNFLVVDGFLNSGGDSSFITLTRTRNLGDTISSIPELNAAIQLESSGTSIDIAQNMGGGRFVFPSLNLSTANPYRLRIVTFDGKQYMSDEMTVKTTPPIDSVNYTYNDKGVTIYVNTHDPSNNTRYYRWDYDETWEYHAPYYSEIIYTGAGNPPYVYRTTDELIFACYRTRNSHKIFLGSSAGLQNDVIFQSPLQFIARRTEEISVRYSINVRQYALTKEAAAYWANLKKTTEQLGSIFDAQPSQLKGNLRNVADTSEPVLGFMSISTVQSKRIFIRRGEVGEWTYGDFCPSWEITPDSFDIYFNRYHYEAITPKGRSNLQGAPAGCVDCRTSGGTLTKPDFW